MLLYLLAASVPFVPGPSEYTITATAPCVDVRPGNEPLACDISGPLNAAMLKCELNPPVIGERAGCTFRIPAGSYWLEDTVRVYRSHAIIGPPCGSSRPGSCLVVTSATTAFHFASPEQALLAGRGLGAEGAKLHRMRIRRFRFEVPEPAFGAHVEGARVHLEDVGLEGFTIGVLADADVHRSPATTANLLQFIRVRAANCMHAGMLLRSGDANAGLVESYDGTANCQRAEFWDDVFDECANLVERSFLGNTIVASHTAVCKDRDTGKLCPGYLSIGNSQRPVFIGPYSESDQAPDVVALNGTSIGGLSFWQGGDGLRIQGPVLSSLKVVNNRDPENVVEFWAGTLAAPGSAFELRAPAISPSWPLAWKAYPAQRQWSLTLANASAYRLLNIEGNWDGPSEQLGMMWVRPPQDCVRFGQSGERLCPLEAF